jgi:hypothetical protein
VKIEIDQSVKIEETARDTVLAFSNSVQRAIVIPAVVKREALAYLRKRGKSRKVAVIVVFAAGLFLLLQNVTRLIDLAIIDREYAGYDAVIKNRLLQFFQAGGLHIYPDTLAFGYVGKKSKAHDLAIGVHRGKLKPDHRVTLKELLDVLR